MMLRRKKTVIFNGLYLFISACIMNTFRLMSNTYSSKHVKVLILTYMRSGSSLTGDILQHSPGSFYVYEPLRSLCPTECSSLISSNLLYADGTKRWAPIPFRKEAYKTLHKWFNCDINMLPTVGLLDIFLGRGLKTSLFPACYVNTTLTTMNHMYSLQVCARKLQDMCEKSPIRIIKTIRTSLKNVKGLLQDLPDLKIIHVIRDPRATLFSQSHFGMCTVIDNGRSRCSDRLCNRLADDIHEKEILFKRYSNRIMTVRYEDLANYPIETSQKMYDFIGVEMTSETKHFIYNKTMAGSESDCSTCSTRPNSSAHVNIWKRRMEREFVEVVNKRCDYVMQRLGYVEYNTR